MSLNVDFRTSGLVPVNRQMYNFRAKDRRVIPLLFLHKPCFGRYAFAEPIGRVIKAGDPVEMI